MKNLSPSFFKSLEKILFIIVLVFFLLFIAGSVYFKHTEKKEEPKNNSSIVDIPVELSWKNDFLKWLHTWKFFPYAENPFNIKLSLKEQKKPENPVPVPKIDKIPPVPEKPQIPPPKKIVPPEKLVLYQKYEIQYRGNYTNLSGAHYAILKIINPDDKKEKMTIVQKNQGFLNFFQLILLTADKIVIKDLKGTTIEIPWNKTVTVKVEKVLDP